FFSFHDPATTSLSTLSLHDALPIYTSPRMLSACTWTCLLPRCNQSSIRPEAELPLKPAHTKQAENVVVIIRLPALWAGLTGRYAQGLLNACLLLRQQHTLPLCLEIGQQGGGKTVRARSLGGATHRVHNFGWQPLAA